jgi:hypothetical protein
MWTVPYAEDDGPDEEFYRRMSAPENEIPVALAENLLLARTDDAAVALVGLQVYSTGVAFTLIVRVRPASQQMAGRSVNDLVWEHGPGSGRFLLGLELSDGRRVSNLRMPGGPADVVFTAGGGSGGEASIEQSWWLHPLPPEGPLRVVVRCAELGIGEADAVLDGTAIRRAAEDVVTLWPWAPPPEHLHAEPPRPPDVPPDSWFARPS